MVHFDFTVDDVDAEAIMGCLQREIVLMHSNICDLIAEKGENPSLIDELDSKIRYCRKNIAYVENLMSNMKNERV